jgi:sterol desaturase/sphingolipid hydroxylase (fatty acid hydroxylase superfamily)
MHHRRRGLGLIFTRHTLQHHRFFTDESMACDSSRDFKIMLFPPVMLVFFIGGLALPIGAAFFWLVSPNAGYLFATAAVAYFLLYEWLHFLYHLPSTSKAARLPFLGRLRRHHQLHHNPRRMSGWNFNITFPIGDLIFGTYWREADREDGGPDPETHPSTEGAG